MNTVKVGVIGGGSVFTPELVQLLLDRNIPCRSLVLMDIDSRRLDIVAGLARRQAAAAGKPLVVETTGDYHRAVADSDFVLIQLRAGGNRMRIEDEALALRHDIPFVETVTVPGLGAFLRSVPIYDQIADLVSQYAPHAQVMNFTNPAGALTQYLQARGINAVGVCNSPPGFLHAAGSVLHLDPAMLAMDWKGLNHLTFVTRLTALGHPDNLLPRVLEGVPGWAPGFPFAPTLLEDVPLGINTYLQYYFHARRRLRELKARSQSRGQQVLALEAELLRIYADESTVGVPDLLKARGGFGYSQVVVNLMQSLLTNDGRLHYVNVRNGGTVPGLPADTVVEVPAVAVNGEVLPLDTGALPDLVLPLVLAMATVYTYWVRAGLARSLADLRRSMLVHPLFPDWEDSEHILQEFFALNAEFVEPYH